MRRTFLLIVVILFLCVVGLYVYDTFHGQKKVPALYRAFGPFCGSRFNAITLPPVGIFICPNHFADESLRRHELVHWEQYRRMSTLSFYARYLMGWVGAGFSYADNWMEQEARVKNRL